MQQDDERRRGAIGIARRHRDRQGAPPGIDGLGAGYSPTCEQSGGEKNDRDRAHGVYSFGSLFRFHL